MYLTIIHYISCDVNMSLFFNSDTLHEKCIILKFQIVVFSVMRPYNLNGRNGRFGLDLLLPSSDSLCRQTQNAPLKNIHNHVYTRL